MLGSARYKRSTRKKERGAKQAETGLTAHSVVLILCCTPTSWESFLVPTYKQAYFSRTVAIASALMC